MRQSGVAQSCRSWTKGKGSWFALAVITSSTASTDKAEESFKRWLHSSRTDLKVRLCSAIFTPPINRLDDAVRIYQDIVTKSPDYAMGRYRLTEILLTKGDTKIANVQIAEALKKDPHDRQALLLRAAVEGPEQPG
jgi:Tfp pilus assembly protein PilF